jgi:hypothetical protein
VDDLAADEAARDVAVDLRRGVERRPAALQRPRARFLVARVDDGYLLVLI